MKIVEKEIDLKTATSLYQEINGAMFYDQSGNPSRRIPGFLNLKLSADKKYWFNKFSTTLKKDIEQYEEVKKELVKKLDLVYEVEENGKRIQKTRATIDDPEWKPKKGSKESAPQIENPALKEFSIEIEKLQSQKESYKVPCYGVEELLSKIETDDFFPNIFELMILEEEDEQAKNI